jgi:hypothetical protein
VPRWWSRFDVEIVSALLCALAGLMLWSASGCGDNIDSEGRSHGIEDAVIAWLTEQGAVHGTVYVCGGDEFCYWPDAADELSALTGGRDCSETERAWPALVGCAYACPPLERGCNALNSCFCEAP